MTNQNEPRTIDDEEARSMGTWTEHNQMPNGEYRFRLRNRDGSAYIRTEAFAGGGWQRSHRHHNVKETYIVQTGRIALAERIGEGLRIRVFTPGQIVTTQPGVPHNVYMFPKSVIHTVKHGEEGAMPDWIADTNLDSETLPLTETKILELAS